MSDVFYFLNPCRVLCARCGQVARGLASIGDKRYCHPDDPDAPDCYTLQHYENAAERWEYRATPTLDCGE